MKIVSGGQTGVDRAALDAALARGLPVGGWCPAGRRAEDGPLPARYPLRETPAADYPTRTEWNVRDADATLILTLGRPSGGTRYTIQVAREIHPRPLRIVELAAAPAPGEVAAWLRARRISVLNVAGPRESGQPGIYRQAHAFLSELFGLLQAPP